MTPLEERAKAGDPAAVNELLRLSMPRVRAIVLHALRGTHASFDVFDDAFSEAMITLWRCLSEWRGDAALLTMAKEPIRRSVWLVALELGHAVSVSRRDPRDDGSLTAESRKGVFRRAASTNEPVTEGGPEFGSLIPAPAVDHDAAIDARRVLAAMKPSQALLLWHVAAEEESRSLLGDVAGESREIVARRFNAATKEARGIMSRGVVSN